MEFEGNDIFKEAYNGAGGAHPLRRPSAGLMLEEWKSLEFGSLLKRYAFQQARKFVEKVRDIVTVIVNRGRKRKGLEFRTCLVTTSCIKRWLATPDNLNTIVQMFQVRWRNCSSYHVTPFATQPFHSPS